MLGWKQKHWRVPVITRIASFEKAGDIATIYIDGKALLEQAISANKSKIGMEDKWFPTWEALLEYLISTTPGIEAGTE